MDTMTVGTISGGSIDEFQRYLSGTGKATNTIRSYSSDLRGWLEWMRSESEMSNAPQTPLAEAASSWMTWSKARGAAPKTIARRVTSLRAFGRWLGYPLLVDYSPPPTPPGTPKPLPGGMDAVNKLLSVAVGDDERCMIALCGFSGLRISEARSVTPASIYLDGDLHWVTVTGKGHKRRQVPIPPSAWERIGPVLDRRSKHEPLVRLTDSQARKAWATCSRQAGLGASSTHQGRATAATELLEATGNLRLVQEVLGHSSVSTTQVYTHVRRSTIAAAMSAL